MSKISLYAEFLGNIGQVSLHASLQTYKNEETKVFITSDQRTITVHHDGETAHLFLPVKVSGTAEVTIPVQQAKELSVRLRVDEALPDAPRVTELVDETYWPASTLGKKTQLKCQTCNSEILQPNKEMVWKDLPSENWAELMDYWHCHKPHFEHDSETVTNGAARKGYSASSRILAKEGIGLVDVSSFLLSAVDCINIQCKSEKLYNGYQELSCKTCDTLLGFQDDQTQGWRIYKWGLSVKLSEAADQEIVSTESVLCTQLLALIDAQAVRKFVVHRGGDLDSDTGILLWIFNPDIWYSNSNIRDGMPRRAMKVFYQSAAKPQKMLEGNSTSLEELYLPTPVLEKFTIALANKTLTLPPSARKFQDWNVGLLDRLFKLSST